MFVVRVLDEEAFKALLVEIRKKVDVTIPAPPREAVAGAAAERRGATAPTVAPSSFLSPDFPPVDAVLSKR